MIWRVRWGNDRFGRLDEFSSESEAFDFASRIDRVDHDGEAVAVRVEVREGWRWRMIATLTPIAW